MTRFVSFFNYIFLNKIHIHIFFWFLHFVLKSQFYHCAKKKYRGCKKREEIFFRYICVCARSRLWSLGELRII